MRLITPFILRCLDSQVCDCNASIIARLVRHREAGIVDPVGIGVVCPGCERESRSTRSGSCRYHIRLRSGRCETVPTASRPSCSRCARSGVEVSPVVVKPDRLIFGERGTLRECASRAVARIRAYTNKLFPVRPRTTSCLLNWR